MTSRKLNHIYKKTQLEFLASFEKKGRELND